jgi:hypothetical protein
MQGVASDLLPAEPSNIQCHKEIRGLPGFLWFEGDANRIRDPRYPIEPADHRRRVGQGGFTQPGPHCLTRTRQGVLVSGQDRVGERKQRATERHIGPGITLDHRLKAEVPVSVVAARTEQRQMADRSIFASVQRRDTSGKQLDLRVADGPIVTPVISHLGSGLIQFLQYVPPMNHAGRHEA